MQGTLEKVERKYAVGLERVPEGMHYRIWAPDATKLGLIVKTGHAGRFELEREPDGYWSGFISLKEEHPAIRYRLVFTGADGKEQEIPDPLSRYSPDGPHGDSVLEEANFAWHDQAWQGVELKGQIITEIHIGTFTPEGTYKAAAAKLPLLKDAGITVVELMPLSEFPGEFGWGYDGVQMFAPYHVYGHPDELRAFVDRAHELGLGVALDVVYNHFGPDANYIWMMAKEFFTDKYPTPWGSAINFDQAGSSAVREYFREVTAHWIREFHIDGLRLDATQSIFDEAAHRGEHPHILAEVARAMREAANGRKTFIVAENDERDTRLINEYGIDGVWDDDMHHAARVAATGRNAFYLSPFRGTAQELLSAARHGYLFQGQTMVAHAGQTTPRPGDSKRHRMGCSARGIPLWRFVTYIENHDQVSSEAQGSRLAELTSRAQYRALVAYILLGPGTPQLFQGQEFGSRSPFPFFSDHGMDLQAMVKSGRYDFLSRFMHGDKDVFEAGYPDPGSRETFQKAVLKWEELNDCPGLRNLFHDLMWLRRGETLLWDDNLQIDGTLLGQDAFLLHYYCGEDERLLAINLGGDFNCVQAANPILAPPAGKQWKVALSTEDAKYGGHSYPAFEDEDGYHLAAHSGLYLKSVPGDPEQNLILQTEEAVKQQ